MRDIIQTIKQKGHRITKQRKQILEVLTDFPRSVSEIKSLLSSKKINIDKVTIYRTVDCFVRLGIVGKTQFIDKEAKYELLVGSGHHHHLVCNKCSGVEDIRLNDTNFIHKIGKKTDFQITSHSLEFFGICAKCRKKYQNE